MLLKELISNNAVVVPTANNFYNSKDWFLLIKNDLVRMLNTWHGKREVIDDYLDDHGQIGSGTASAITNIMDVTLMGNAWKYDRLYDVYVAKYNPIWNYDGSETRTRTRNVTDDHDGKDTSTLSGKDSTEQSGSITDTAGGALTDSRTTFDSSTFLDTDKSTDTRTNTKAFNQKKDETTWGKKDTMEYDSTHTIAESESETLVRGGNQGTTTTQAMIEEQLKLAGKLNLLQVIALDVVQGICYI